MNLANLFKRYEKCWGLSSPAIGRYKIELWFCPPHYSIRPHTHANEDIELVFLFGHNVRFHRKRKRAFLGESILVKYFNFGRRFSIRAGDEHSFDVSSFPLVFINIEKWHCKPTSAAEDLQLV